MKHDSATGIFIIFQGSFDLAQGTGFQKIQNYILTIMTLIANGTYLHFFNPSSTTFVKHFMSSNI